MWHEFGLILAALGALALVGVIVWWVLDLVWMCAMHWSIALSVVLVVAFSYTVLHSLTAKASFSILASIGVTALLVRPAIDVIVWLYDVSPLLFQRSWRFVILEDPAEYQKRKADLPEWHWDYYRVRVRDLREYAYDADDDANDALEG